MASPKALNICHVCGYKNQGEADRCVSCGARLEELAVSYTEAEQAKRRTQQTGFAVIWAVVAFVVHLTLQGIVLIALPLAIDAYDPQGFSALAISVAVWFFGGIFVGFASPGKTFLEPAVGALFAVIPTVWYLVSITPAAPEHLGGGFQLTMPAYVIGGVMGGMMSLFGAFIGEWLQDTLRGSGKKARA
jgi:hypothetical protein